MKICHINLGDSARFGGTAVAAIRLSQALQRAGVESQMLCGYLDQPAPDVRPVPRPMWTRLVEAPGKRVLRSFGFNDLHNISTFLLKQEKSVKQAELLNLHCLHHGFFNYLALPGLTKDKPTVFTLHDMWAFTGHCSYSFACDRWQTGCGQCPDLQIIPAVKRDSTRAEWALKHWVYQHSKLVIICPSQWMADLAQQSMLRHLPIYPIPNGIDTQVFQPLDPSFCRAELGLPLDKHILMFGATSLQDYRKGGDLLPQILNDLPESLKTDMVLITLGAAADELAAAVEMPVVNLGYTTDDLRKAMMYSAADLFVFPTRADNLPLMLQESMACGTPMVSFDVGGVAELVRPDITGYLAPPEDCRTFSNSIVQALEDEPWRHRLAQQCRQVAVDEYSLELQVSRYLLVYQQALGG